MLCMRWQQILSLICVCEAPRHQRGQCIVHSPRSFRPQGDTLICQGTRQGRAFFKNTIPPSREHISQYIFSQSKKNAGYHYANPETWPACWVHWSRLVFFFWKMVFTNLIWLLWGVNEKTTCSTQRLEFTRQ